MRHTAAAQAEIPDIDQTSALTDSARALLWRAPELALILAERASQTAVIAGNDHARLAAESVVVSAANQMDRSATVVDRAIDATRNADARSASPLTWQLHVELAICARIVGAPLTSFGLLLPVLRVRQQSGHRNGDVPKAILAQALVQASESLVALGKSAVLSQALAEAEQLYRADSTLDRDIVLLQCAQVEAIRAAQHRRWGELEVAERSCRAGFAALDQLTDPLSDGGQSRARLTCELTAILLDAGKVNAAMAAAAQLLEQPVRGCAAAAVGWLRLTIASRVKLPAGQVTQARELLLDVVDSSRRYQLYGLHAESQRALANLYEAEGEFSQALSSLRASHAAERVRMQAIYQARSRFAAEFANEPTDPATMRNQLAQVLEGVDGGRTLDRPDAPVVTHFAQRARHSAKNDSTPTNPELTNRDVELSSPEPEQLSVDNAINNAAVARANIDSGSSQSSVGKRRRKDPDDLADTTAVIALDIDSAKKEASLSKDSLHVAVPQDFAEIAELNDSFSGFSEKDQLQQIDHSGDHIDDNRKTPAQELVDQQSDEDAPARGQGVLAALKAAGLLNSDRSGGRRRKLESEDNSVNNISVAQLRSRLSAQHESSQNSAVHNGYAYSEVTDAAIAESGPMTPEQAEATLGDEDLSLGELLSQALAAYEQGRRDEEIGLRDSEMAQFDIYPSRLEFDPDNVVAPQREDELTMPIPLDHVGANRIAGKHQG